MDVFFLMRHGEEKKNLIGLSRAPMRIGIVHDRNALVLHEIWPVHGKTLIVDVEAFFVHEKFLPRDETFVRVDTKFLRVHVTTFRVDNGIFRDPHEVCSLVHERVREHEDD